ncbi:MAG: hypothetical protein Q8Q15_03030 [bacterium]|nr:hypothetical protein [bacterium]
MKKIFLPVLFLLFAPLTIAVSVFSLWQFSKEKPTLMQTVQKGTVLGNKMPIELYSALPSAVGSIDYEITGAEARPIIIKQFLENYHSPIAPYAESIFQASEKWGLDYRLIVAISQCESNLCKRIPEGSYNCWGWGNGETRFDSWDQAFNQVAKTLKKQYIDKGLITPEQIMPKYAPPSVEKGGPWAKCVNQYLEEME